MTQEVGKIYTWESGECPVHPNTKVKVWFTEGSPRVHNAGDLRWSKDTTDLDVGIIAYQVLEHYVEYNEQEEFITTGHFNQLTPAEAERLAMLAEEAAEIIQVVGKILRHGYTSYDPNDSNKVTNRVLLRNEIIDLRAISYSMVNNLDIGNWDIHDVQRAWVRKLKYSHHQ